MAELASERADKEVMPRPQSSIQSQARARSSCFKYYIHDSTQALRLQLLGQLTSAELSELSGCWRTAKTTLGDRKLVLDVERLETADEASKQWLREMAKEGATYVPDSYLRNGLSRESIAPQAAKPGVLGKLVAIFRGSRVVAESSTQAQ